MEDKEQAMKRDGDFLPSTLYANFNDHSGEDSLDHGSLLHNLLSLLYTLEDVAPYFSSLVPSSSRDGSIFEDRDYDIARWISGSITHGSLPIPNANNDGTMKQKDPLFQEWSIALRYIHDLLKHISPFELHIVASQSIIFSEDLKVSHTVLCLLLCAHSLQQCPPLKQKRWKRWQSLICETVRIFQDSIETLHSKDESVVSGIPMFSIFIYHIAPSCLHAIDQLPFENHLYHVAIFSSLVGTNSKLIEMIIFRCQKELSNRTEDYGIVQSHFMKSLHVVYDMIHLIISHFDRFGGFSETSLWLEPLREPPDKEVNRNEDVDFWMHRNSLSWWAYHRSRYDPEERIANMDTSFHKTGLGLLAMKAFEERPMVYHPNFVWIIWFPHVAVLFRDSTNYPGLLQKSTIQFLESLIKIVPEETLVLERATCGTPESLFDLFHLLSNHLMRRIQKKSFIEEGEEDASSFADEEAQFRMHSQHTVGLIKALLTRFTTAGQVKIIEKVIQNCSIPGLKARFLDLLRPLVMVPDVQTRTLLWKIIMSILDDLFKRYWNQNEKNLIDVDSLINRDIEISVGAITMIQMWSLATGNEFPNNGKGLGEKLLCFRISLQNLLGRWSEDESLAPQMHYRLFLLDNALQSACESLLD